MDPEDRVDGCVCFFLREFVMVLVCTRCMEYKEKEEEWVVGVSAHDGDDVRQWSSAEEQPTREGASLVPTAAGAWRLSDGGGPVVA